MDNYINGRSFGTNCKAIATNKTKQKKKNNNDNDNKIEDAGLCLGNMEFGL